MHMLPTHFLPGSHALPHMPQFLGSLTRSMHAVEPGQGWYAGPHSQV